MINLVDTAAQGVISAFLETSLKAVAEKVRKGKKLTQIETLTLFLSERFNSVDVELRGLRDGQASLRNRIESLTARLNLVHEVAELKATVAQLEARR